MTLVSASEVREAARLIAEHVALALPTTPLQRAGRGNGSCVVGLVDPAVRRWLPRDLLAFSTTANRFVTLAARVPRSFLVS